MGNVGKAGRCNRGALQLIWLLALACASRPEAPPTPASPAPIVPNSAGSDGFAIDPVEQCALVATVLTEPDPALGGRSAIERPEAARAKQVDGRWVVALLVLDRAGNAISSRLEPSDCSDRLVLTSVNGPWPAGVAPFLLRLAPEGNGAFHFVLVLGHGGRTPVQTDGRVERDERGEWRTADSFRKAPRPLDAAPVERVLAEAIPTGQALAWLELDTGADTMSVRSLETGLVLVVRWDNRELRQVFASCPAGSKGSVFGDLARGILDQATCGDLYRLTREGSTAAHGRAEQRLVVVKQLPDGTWQPSITLPLPPEIRHISGPSLERSRSDGG